MKTTDECKIHVLSHTHWDREWYQDFQGFRQRLVFQINALLDLLDKDPDYKCFHLDGQTCCIADYLDIMPDNEERLRKHLTSGRIVIGPWFAMPDELLLSGESLVRNLMLGYKICSQFNVEPMQIGYVSDIFGHCSQFPQILNGFGIDTVFLHRGTTCEEDETTEMIWVGADGTESLIIKAFPDTGYQDFFVMREAEESVLLEYEVKKRALSATGITFALDGNDHQAARADTLQKIERMNNIFKETVCKHSSMGDFLNELKSKLSNDIKEKIKRYRGELRFPAKVGLCNELFNGTASSRVNLKQENDKVEYLLSRNAEQMNVWSYLSGGDDQRRFLDLAWRYLLLNHPHDSIVGCSMDQVHQDMIYRFDQVRMLAENSIWESVQYLDEVLNTAAFGEESRIVTVHNQSSSEQGPVMRFTFDAFSEDVKKQRAIGMQPALFDESGVPVKFHIVDVEHRKWREPFARKVKGETSHYLTTNDVWIERDRFHIVANVSIPAFGFKTWRIGFLPEASIASIQLPVELGKSVVIENGKSLENEFILLRANPDATIDILDKLTGRLYSGLHRLEDCGDKGTGWDHLYPENDLIVDSTVPGTITNVRISSNDMDGLSSSITISYNIKIPANLTSNRKSRLKQTVSNKVKTTFTLDAGARRVDCETEIDNAADCHRMRLMFPTRLQSATWFGDTAFDIVERNIKIFDSTGWKEPAREETPIKNFAAALNDDGEGFAVITKGLCEACVRDNKNRDLALTLFRSFSEELYGCWTQESQMKGKLLLEYSLVPFNLLNNNLPVDLLLESERIKMKVYSFTEQASKGTIEPSGQFMRISANVIVSTLKTSEDGKGVVLRIFNPDDLACKFQIELMYPIVNAQECDMNENKIASIEHHDYDLEMEIGAKKVMTIYLEISTIR